MAGIGEAGAVEHGFGDRIGDDRGGAVRAITSAMARRMAAIAAGALVASGLPGSAVTGSVERDHGQG